MSYKIDGSSHRNGVANENDVASFLNSIQYEGATWIKQGGTKTLFDVVKGTGPGSSIKRQTNGTSTFAWDNRGWSLLPEHILPPLIAFKQEIKTVRQLEEHERVALIARYRRELATATNQSLLLLLSNQQWLDDYISNLFLNHYQTVEYIFIANKAEKSLLVIKPSDLPIVRKLQAGWKPVLLEPTRRGVKSLRLQLQSPNGEMFNPGIQFRLKDTQGIRAFLKLNPKYKNSDFCFGLQQSGAHILSIKGDKLNM